MEENWNSKNIIFSFKLIINANMGLKLASYGVYQGLPAVILNLSLLMWSHDFIPYCTTQIRVLKHIEL